MSGPAAAPVTPRAAVLATAAAGLLLGLVPPDPPAPDPAGPPSGWGHPATVATLHWLGAVATFPDALDGAGDPRPVLDHVDAAVRLDPTFDAAWVWGSVMVRLLDPDAGPRFIAHGRARRPDLAFPPLGPTGAEGP